LGEGSREKIRGRGQGEPTLRATAVFREKEKESTTGSSNEREGFHWERVFNGKTGKGKGVISQLQTWQRGNIPCDVKREEDEPQKAIVYPGGGGKSVESLATEDLYKGLLPDFVWGEEKESLRGTGVSKTGFWGKEQQNAPFF